MLFFGKAPIAAAEGRRVMFCEIWGKSGVK